MKCIQCQTDNNLKERTEHQGRCKNCGHPFAFEPTSMTEIRFTDPFFAKVISDISADGTLFFTSKQFLYVLEKRLKLTPEPGCLDSLVLIITFFSFLFSFLSLIIIINLTSMYITQEDNQARAAIHIFCIPIFIALICSIFNQYKSTKSQYKSFMERQKNAVGLQRLGIITLLIGMIISLFILDSFIIFSSSVILGMLSLYLGKRQLGRQRKIPKSFSIIPNQFEEWLNRWTEVNGSLEKMLPPPRQENTEAEISPDISAYSFDRVIICDNAAIAQLLIANNFHFENNCAVLSINGYPQPIFRTVLQMLKRNPQLKVYALHDASPRGVRLVHHLQTSQNWFADSTVKIYDLGLLPRQILTSKRPLFIRASAESGQQAKQLSPQIRQNLSADEIEWLELGNFVELESFTPRRLLQSVTQGIRRSLTLDIDSREDDTASSDIYVFYEESFG
jgi:hypothetical protein